MRYIVMKFYQSTAMHSWALTADVGVEELMQFIQGKEFEEPKLGVIGVMSERELLDMYKKVFYTPEPSTNVVDK